KPACNWLVVEHYSHGQQMSDRMTYCDIDPRVHRTPDKFVPVIGHEYSGLRVGFKEIYGTIRCMVISKEGMGMGWIEGDIFERLRSLDACGHIVKVDCRFLHSHAVGGGGMAYEGVFRFNAYGCPKDIDRTRDARRAGAGDADRKKDMGAADTDSSNIRAFDGVPIKSEFSK
ncbi:hypothetical protein BJ508DRAFT_316367, partial [Ascobolus immersus RN42]